MSNFKFYKLSTGSNECIGLNTNTNSGFYGKTIIYSEPISDIQSFSMEEAKGKDGNKQVYHLKNARYGQYIVFPNSCVPGTLAESKISFNLESTDLFTFEITPDEESYVKLEGTNLYLCCWHDEGENQGKLCLTPKNGIGILKVKPILSKLIRVESEVVV